MKKEIKRWINLLVFCLPALVITIMAGAIENISIMLVGALLWFIGFVRDQFISGDTL